MTALYIATRYIAVLHRLFTTLAWVHWQGQDTLVRFEIFVLTYLVHLHTILLTAEVQDFFLLALEVNF